VTVPPGYTALTTRSRRAVVRDDLVPVLGSWLLAAPLGPPADATPIDGGRGGAFRVRLRDDARAVMRFGRRGGAVARVVREWYVGLRPRPWRELAVTLTARARGAPVPEVVAACVHGWGAYRSAIVTIELPNVTPLLTALATAPAGEARHAIARAASAAVARLHHAGVVHPDLHLGNIVIGHDGAAILDLDRARIRGTPLMGKPRERSLRRLARSVRRLDPAGATIDAATARAFHDGYRQTLAEAACVS
jgi:tRNA A-37 threonylcarbamoyl transferase component Bud32